MCRTRAQNLPRSTARERPARQALDSHKASSHIENSAADQVKCGDASILLTTTKNRSPSGSFTKSQSPSSPTSSSASHRPATTPKESKKAALNDNRRSRAQEVLSSLMRVTSKSANTIPPREKSGQRSEGLSRFSLSRNRSATIDA